MTRQVSDHWISGALINHSSFFYSLSLSVGRISLGISILALPSTCSALPAAGKVHTPRSFSMKQSLIRNCHERLLHEQLLLSAAMLKTQGSLSVANKRFLKSLHLQMLCCVWK